MKPWRSLVAVLAATLTASCAAVWGFDDAVLGDASTPDASLPDVAVPDAYAADASVEGDAVVDRAVDATPDVSPVLDAAPPAMCAPACAIGYSCVNAVGGHSVCVAAQGTCTDSTACSFSGCCVWTDPTSATGRCEAPAFPAASSGVSCLCTGKQTDPARMMCKTCAAPASDPSAPVLVCSGT